MIDKKTVIDWYYSAQALPGEINGQKLFVLRKQESKYFIDFAIFRGYDHDNPGGVWQKELSEKDLFNDVVLWAYINKVEM